jgi:hypothetical protein
MNKHDPNKIVNYLSTQTEPQAIETIRANTNISHWSMALAYCLELVIQGKIKGMKTSKSWVFWVEKGQKAARTGGEILARS